MSQKFKKQGEPAYAKLLAERLRDLRLARKWSISQLAHGLAKQGHDVEETDLYAYERGQAGGGEDLPWDLVPLIARVYQFELPAEWLP